MIKKTVWEGSLNLMILTLIKLLQAVELRFYMWSRFFLENDFKLVYIVKNKMELYISQVTVNQAKHQLAQLIRKVLAGEEVVIVKGKTPLVKLVPLQDNKTQRKIGADKGLMEISEDFNAALDDFKEYISCKCCWIPTPFCG